MITNEYKEFYPTPKSLIGRMLDGIQWKENMSVLEPSAGKGDLCDAMAEAAGNCVIDGHRYRSNIQLDIDTVEKNGELKAALKGKGYPVVAEDFLTFHTYKHYDLIVMNPPFSNGDAHLMHALEMQESGGAVVCILNAETLKNPYSNLRKTLVNKLKEYQADITYLNEAFCTEDTERKTEVEIALVKVIIPEKESTVILDSLKKREYEEYTEENMTDVALNDYIVSAVKLFEKEVQLGIRLIKEYQSLKPYMKGSFSDDMYSGLTLELHMGKEEASVNRYVERVRMKYWTALFTNERFTKDMTSEQRKEYLAKVTELANYDFSVHNIREIQIQMKQTMVKSIEDCIMNLFEKLSSKYSWYPESENNIHYYNGWATNKAYMINKKVIIPLKAWDDIFKCFRYSYDIEQKLSDMEKVFAYLGAERQCEESIRSILSSAEKEERTKDIRCRYFNVTFYKKGTCHITFTDEEALKRFNIFGSRMLCWLPQYYGKKHYKDMTPEEKAVIDSFQGEISYEAVVREPDKWLYKPTVMALEAAS